MINGEHTCGSVMLWQSSRLRINVLLVAITRCSSRLVIALVLVIHQMVGFGDSKILMTRRRHISQTKEVRSHTTWLVWLRKLIVRIVWHHAEKSKMDLQDDDEALLS